MATADASPPLGVLQRKMRIETKRLYLRPFAPDEYELFHDLLSNETVMKFSLAGPLSRDRSKSLFLEFQQLEAEKGFSPWAVFTKEKNEFIGLCGIQEFEIEGKKELEITFRLLPEHWGKGYGSEAAEASYRYAFEVLESEIIFSAIEPANTHALRVAETNGLERLSNTTIHGKEVAFYAKRKNKQNNEANRTASTRSSCLDLGQRMKMTELKSPATDFEWDAYHRIRKKVLWEARGRFGIYDASHPDEYKENNHPKLLLLDSRPVGVIRIDLDRKTKSAYFRRVAIDSEVQRRGLGKEIMKLSEDFACSQGCNQLIANVSLDAVEFYEKIGYRLDSDHPENDQKNPRMTKAKSTNPSVNTTPVRAPR